MAKFRKKPMVIEAIQFTGADSYYKQMEIQWPEFAGKCSYFSDTGLVILLPKGDAVKVFNGDWVIKGIKGEFYPCESGIFEQTYDKVSE